MSMKVIGLMVLLVVVTAIIAFNVATTMARIRQDSAVAAPVRAMLHEVVVQMQAGHQERALRMTGRLEQGLMEYLNQRGPTPEQFMSEITALE